MSRYCCAQAQVGWEDQSPKRDHDRLISNSMSPVLQPKTPGTMLTNGASATIAASVLTAGALGYNIRWGTPCSSTFPVTFMYNAEPGFSRPASLANNVVHEAVSQLKNEIQEKISKNNKSGL